MILLAHWRMRREMAAAQVPASDYPVPFFPVPNVLALAFMAGVILLLASTEDGRSAFLVGAGALVALAIAYAALVRGRGREAIVLDQSSGESSRV